MQSRGAEGTAAPSKLGRSGRAARVHTHTRMHTRAHVGMHARLCSGAAAMQGPVPARRQRRAPRPPGLRRGGAPGRPARPGPAGISRLCRGSRALASCGLWRRTVPRPLTRRPALNLGAPFTPFPQPRGGEMPGEDNFFLHLVFKKVVFARLKVRWGARARARSRRGSAFVPREAFV